MAREKTRMKGGTKGKLNLSTFSICAEPSILGPEGTNALAWSTRLSRMAMI